MKTYNVVFNQVAEIKIQANSIEEAEEKAYKYLDEGYDLNWTEVDIADIETEEE